MDAALGWIGELVRAMASVVPRLVLVRKTEQAVKFIRGSAKVVGPGLHVFWPVTTEVDVVPVVRQVMELAPQTLLTTDAVPVVVGGVVIYAITDLHAYLVENFDASESLSEAAQAGIRNAVVSLSLDDLQEARVKLDRKLTRAVGRAVKEFGVEVEAARLTTLAPANVLSLVGEPLVRA